MGNFYRDLGILRDVVVHGQTIRHVAHEYGLSKSSVEKIYRKAINRLRTYGYLNEIKSEHVPLDMLRMAPLNRQVWHAISDAVIAQMESQWDDPPEREHFKNTDGVFRLCSLRGCLL